MQTHLIIEVVRAHLLAESLSQHHHTLKHILMTCMGLGWVVYINRHLIDLMLSTWE